jgi:hypothetical protein
MKLLLQSLKDGSSSSSRSSNWLQGMSGAVSAKIAGILLTEEMQTLICPVYRIYSLAHLAVPHGGRQYAGIQPGKNKH